MRKKILIFLYIVSLANFSILFSTKVNAQVQSTPFSANDITSYQCFDDDGNILSPSPVKDSSGYFLCYCRNSGAFNLPPFLGYCPGLGCQANDWDNDGIDEPGRPGDPGCIAQRAVLIPPTLQQLEIWFVRIIYVIWTLVATFSVFYLLVLGYRWMISRGDVTKITEIRQKIIYYIIGLILVFLAIPVLTTIFRLLGVNEQVQCYNVNMDEIGFQFFFSDLCTAKDYDYVCANIPVGGDSGLACANTGDFHFCTNGKILRCNPSTQTMFVYGP